MNLIYWNFGFLRMGTSGFAAQAYGARNLSESVRVFVRAITIALLIALLLIVFQLPISRLALYVIPCDDSVCHLALTYFFIRIWAAPATLGLYALKGWFIGMQNSKTPMWIAIFINLLNIVFSLLFVLYWKMDIAGVAWGTVIAQYGGLVVGCVIAYKYYGKLFRRYLDIKSSLNIAEMKKFFHINADIFLRTFCLAVVFTFITSASSSISKKILAIDSLLLQFFTLFSYIMDGFAYAGESLAGRYIGARDKQLLHKAVNPVLPDDGVGIRAAGEGSLVGYITGNRSNRRIPASESVGGFCSTSLGGQFFRKQFLTFQIVFRKKV